MPSERFFFGLRNVSTKFGHGREKLVIGNVDDRIDGSRESTEPNSFTDGKILRDDVLRPRFVQVPICLELFEERQEVAHLDWLIFRCHCRFSFPLLFAASCGTLRSNLV